MNSWDGWDTPDDPTESEDEGYRQAVFASGQRPATLPTIASAADIPAAIKYAESDPRARWYVIKRAASLNEFAQLPTDWDLSGLRIDVDGRSFELPSSNGYPLRAAALAREIENPPDIAFSEDFSVRQGRAEQRDDDLRRRNRWRATTNPETG